jgi:ATP-binding cassette subfamily B protein
MKSIDMQTFLAYTKHFKRQAVLLAVVFLANILLQILAPEVLSRFLDGVEGGTGWLIALWMILFYVAALALQAIAGLVLTYVSKWVGSHITDDYRNDVLKHYLRIGMSHHVRWTSGEVMTRLDEDVQGLFTYHYILFFKIIGNAVLLLCILAALAVRNGLLAAALFVLSVVTIVVFKWIQDRGIPKYTRQQKATAELNGSMKEMVDNTAVVRSMDATSYIEGKLKDAMRIRFRESLPAGLMYGNLWTASTLLQGLTYAAALLIGVWLWDSHAISMGVVYLILVYTGQIYGPLQRFRTDLGDMQKARGSMVRMEEFMAVPEDDRHGSQRLDDQPIHLTIKDLYFSYDGEADVLRGVSLELRSGESVGIMGETGCGKSTLVNLVAGLYPYERGEILLNNISLRDVTPGSFRNRIAYCTQNVQLIHGTLRDNITMYDKRYGDDQIAEAVDKLGLSDWFGKFPDGLDTLLSMGEDHLSSGEAQLVSLIRLALKNPGLVLLDEITARLDPTTRHSVMAAVVKLCEGRSVIAIAHDAAAIGWVERIIHMADGIFTPSTEV